MVQRIETPIDIDFVDFAAWDLRSWVVTGRQLLKQVQISNATAELFTNIVMAFDQEWQRSSSKQRSPHRSLQSQWLCWWRHNQVTTFWVMAHHTRFEVLHFHDTHVLFAAMEGCGHLPFSVQKLPITWSHPYLKACKKTLQRCLKILYKSKYSFTNGYTWQAGR